LQRCFLRPTAHAQVGKELVAEAAVAPDRADGTPRNEAAGPADVRPERALRIVALALRRCVLRSAPHLFMTRR
jgi:hypothetical protein